MAPAPRRRNLLGHRHRVEDEGDDDVRPDGLDGDDDSLTDGTMATDGHDAAADSDTSNIEDASPSSAAAHNTSNGSAKPRASRRSKSTLPPAPAGIQGASPAKPSHDGQQQPPQTQAQANDVVPSPPKSPSAPVIVSSASAMNPPTSDANARRRNENDDYKRRRDQDPAFVPNRGAFFMHDSRQAGGPPGNTLRSFGRGRGRGGRGGYPGNGHGRIKYAAFPASHILGRVAAYANPLRCSPMYQPTDPTTNSNWTHDMHDKVSIPSHSRRSRQVSVDEGPPNGNGYIPTCKESDTPINRTLSTEKHVGNVQVRVYLPHMEDPTVYSGIQIKQYTKLPDHRPPLRRDKPVRISLPERAPRYIYPAPDRSFTFIPRALRPNQQQRVRGKPRSGFASVGGFSRRTSIFGGGSYYGSMYSPSVNLSRRSSIVHDREFMFSPTGSTISRAPHPGDNRPVVRLPPVPRMDMMPDIGSQFGQPMPMPEMPPAPARMDGTSVDASGPALPMHQPRPQKNISVAHIESPTMAPGGQPFQQAFHQQMPVQVGGGGGGYPRDGHSRRQSHSQRVSGTPLSHIPERSAHGAAYNHHAYQQQGYYQGQPQHVQPTQQGYYYQGGYAGGSMNGQASGYPSNVPSPMAGNYAMQGQMEQQPSQGSNNLVAQEVNGMVYYFDPSQMQPPTTYPPYPSTQTYPTSSMGMHGMMTPSPDAFYYPQNAPGMVYYPQ